MRSLHSTRGRRIAPKPLLAGYKPNDRRARKCRQLRRVNQSQTTAAEPPTGSDRPGAAIQIQARTFSEAAVRTPHTMGVIAASSHSCPQVDHSPSGFVGGKVAVL